jgi:hypothetical protein
VVHRPAHERGGGLGGEPPAAPRRDDRVADLDGAVGVGWPRKPASPMTVSSVRSIRVQMPHGAVSAVAPACAGRMSSRSGAGQPSASGDPISRSAAARSEVITAAASGGAVAAEIRCVQSHLPQG